MMEAGEVFVISPQPGGEWRLAHEYDEAEEFYSFADVDAAKAKASALAGYDLRWREGDAGTLHAVSEDTF